ncbi:MAG: right-handed parallel beta-helix repeat-containing protein [Clostridia bacterium]|nr:right-handed parallel beta-helix repeat-containing protein [Clostridia bacterium]
MRIYLKAVLSLTLAFMLAISFAACGDNTTDGGNTDSPEKTNVVLYVSVDGSGEGDGTRENPFATVEAARDEIRIMKKSGGLPEGGVTVVISEGVYDVADTIEFTREDSGEADKPVIYTVEKKGSVILDGGFTPTESGAEAQGPAMINGSSVSYIAFDGITFENSDGPAVILSASDVNSPMTGVKISGCTVRNISGAAFIISDAVNTVIENNVIYDVGGGGIYLENSDTVSRDPAKNTVKNNLIHDFSKTVSASGICVRGIGFTVTNNEIYNGNYCAITAYTGDSMIQYNICHNVNYKGGNKYGAITVGGDWTEVGNVIRYNYIYDVIFHIQNKPGMENPMPCGIYVDGTVPGQYIYGNTICDVNGDGMSVGSGKNLTVRNNLIMNVGHAPICIHDSSTKKDDLAYNGGYTGYWEDLQKMDYTSEYLLAMYPELSLMLEVGGDPFDADDPATQSYSIVEGNVLYGSEGIHDAFPSDFMTESPFELYSYDDVVLAGGRTYTYGTVRNNLKYLVLPKYGIGTVGKVAHALTEESQVYYDIVDFPRIPYEMIGVLSGEESAE